MGQLLGVSESLKSARHWSGFVCPDCRFVFRVPRNHGGKGIICPSCRHILRIPAADDVSIPLTVPLWQTGAKKKSADKMTLGVRKKHRSHRSDGSENLEWERSHRPTKRSEKNQIQMMLFSGGTLFALIVAGVIFALHGGNPTQKTAEFLETSPEITEVPNSAKLTGSRSETALAAEAGPLARKFLEATGVEEILPLVRNPEIAESHIRSFYPDGKIPPAGLSHFNISGSGESSGLIVSYTVRTRDQDEKPMAFVDGPGGLKIDWESWVGWSEISWKEFLATKTTTGRVFRLSLAPIDYYNYDFKDEQKWQSYRLEPPNHESSIYGYVEKGSPLDRKIRSNGDEKSVLLMLSLKFPEEGMSPNQVLIDRLVAEGWVEGNAKP